MVLSHSCQIFRVLLQENLILRLLNLLFLCLFLLLLHLLLLHLYCLSEVISSRLSRPKIFALQSECLENINLAVHSYLRWGA